LIYRTLFYVNIYGSYKLSKNSPVFLAQPVDKWWSWRNVQILVLNLVY